MSKKPLRELQSVRITQATKSAFVAYGSENVIVPAGSTGAVLEVFGDAEDPRSYLVEVHLNDPDEYATADVPAEFVEPQHTPEEEAVLEQYMQRSSDARAEVRALDPDWRAPDYWADTRARPSPTFAEWVTHLEVVIAAAQARLKELRDMPSTPPAPAKDSSES